MELYIDESGNTGNVIAKNKKYNFDNQSHFVLCGIKVVDENDKSLLIEKYNKFKSIFGIAEEIKGSDLMTRKYNAELEYFIDNVLDSEHFKICVYDKKFYLATLLLVFLLGNEFQNEFSDIFYQLATELSFWGDEVLISYCEVVEDPTEKHFEQLLKTIIKHSYREIPEKINPLVLNAKKILSRGNYLPWLDILPTYGIYKNAHYINVINLNCLSELILVLKIQENLLNSELKIYHDRIDGYDETFLDELGACGIDITIKDSKEENLIQLADNAVSIFSKCVNEVIKKFEKKKEWKFESRWIMEHYASIINKISVENIKFVLPISNWAASLCVRDMFDKKFPKEKRNNLYFNYGYAYYMELIKEDLKSKNFDMNCMIELLKN